MILSHLLNLPQFNYLKQQACYRKFLTLLSPKWQRAIAFVYVKNDTLFIVLKHPGFKMELNYNRDLLKSVLTQMTAHDPECRMLQANKVAIFHSRYYTMTPKKENETIPRYYELAAGDFSVNSEDPDLAARFEKTKRLIACNK